MSRLFSHKVKGSIRSTMFTQNIIASVLILLATAYLIGIVVFLSLQVDNIIAHLYVGQDVLPVFTGLLFYYFIYDVLLRFLFQEIPTLSIKPYLVMAIKKKKLLHYILKSSMLSVFNALGVLLITPFFVKNVWPKYSASIAIVWLLSLISLIIINNYLTVWLKKVFIQRPLLIITLLIIFVLTTILEYFGQLPLSVKFSNLILTIAQHPLYLTLPILLSTIMYYGAYIMLSQNAYIEDIAKKKHNSTALQFSFLKKYGELGNLLMLEFKLITRNKRPRSLSIISFLFLLYGFMFYQGSMINNYYQLLLVGMILTGMFAMNYGQLLFSWESTYFDFLSTSHISIKKYLQSKYLLFSGISIITYLLTLPYAFIDSKIALINTGLVIYNIGFSNVFVIALAAFNTSQIDLGRSQMMNTQGINALQYIKTLPIIGIPALIIYLSSLTGHTSWGFVVLALIGIVSIIFRDYLLDRIAELLQQRKHKMLVGFRRG